MAGDTTVLSYELAEGWAGSPPPRETAATPDRAARVRPGVERHVKPNRTTETTLGVQTTGATKLAR
jgi:hypothetical protein